MWKLQPDLIKWLQNLKFNWVTLHLLTKDSTSLCRLMSSAWWFVLVLHFKLEILALFVFVFVFIKYHLSADDLSWFCISSIICICICIYQVLFVSWWFVSLVLFKYYSKQFNHCENNLHLHRWLILYSVHLHKGCSHIMSANLKGPKTVSNNVHNYVDNPLVTSPAGRIKKCKQISGSNHGSVCT